MKRHNLLLRLIVSLTAFILIFSMVYWLFVLKPNVAEDVFTLNILDTDIYSAKTPWLGSDFETAWPILLNAYPSRVVYKISLSDIENYDWLNQKIILTAIGSSTFEKHFLLCNRVRIDHCMKGFHFLMALENEPIYGGIILDDTPTATFYNFPILMFEKLDGKIIIILSPNNSLSMKFDESEWQIIKNIRIKNVFEAKSKVIK